MTNTTTATECEFIVDTKYGELLIVDEAKNYRESKQFCEEKLGGKLPTIANTSMITDLKSYLLPCTKHGYHGNAYEMVRNQQKWRVGLSYDDGEGAWSDGRPYEYKADTALFKYYALWGYGYQPHPDQGCQNAVLNAYDSWTSTGKLETVPCAGEYPFVCVRKAREAVNATTEDPFQRFADYNIASNNVAVVATADGSGEDMVARAFTSPVVIGLTVLAAVLLLLHIFFMVRGVVRRRRVYNGMADADNKQDIELQQLDSNSTSQTSSEGAPDV